VLEPEPGESGYAVYTVNDPRVIYVHKVKVLQEKGENSLVERQVGKKFVRFELLTEGLFTRRRHAEQYKRRKLADTEEFLECAEILVSMARTDVAASGSTQWQSHGWHPYYDFYHQQGTRAGVRPS